MNKKLLAKRIANRLNGIKTKKTRALTIGPWNLEKIRFIDVAHDIPELLFGPGDHKVSEVAIQSDDGTVIMTINRIDIFSDKIRVYRDEINTNLQDFRSTIINRGKIIIEYLYY